MKKAKKTREPRTAKARKKASLTPRNKRKNVMVVELTRLVEQKRTITVLLRNGVDPDEVDMDEVFEAVGGDDLDDPRWESQWAEAASPMSAVRKIRYRRGREIGDVTASERDDVVSVY